MGGYMSSGLPRVVFIEGNIGSGKSSVLDELEKQGEFVVREAVDSWSFLPLRYTDPTRWMFSLQVEIAASIQKRLCEALEKTPEDKIIFLERSLISALLFSKVAYKNLHLTKEEFTLFESLCEKSIEKYTNISSLVVYINCDTDICLQRIKYRNRDKESSTITIEYLDALKSEMDTQFNSNCVIIDGTKTTKDIAMDILSHLNTM